MRNNTQQQQQKQDHQHHRCSSKSIYMIGVIIFLTCLSILSSNKLIIVTTNQATTKATTTSTTAVSSNNKIPNVVVPPSSPSSSSLLDTDTIDHEQYWIKQMKKHGLVKSVKQQMKFHQQRQIIERQWREQQQSTKQMKKNDTTTTTAAINNTTMSISNKLLYSVNTCQYSSIKLSNKFIYRHVWKSGGTTIGMYTNTSQKSLTDPSISSSPNNKMIWFTLVRDPISHFLSGWAECGTRYLEGQLMKRGLGKRRSDGPNGSFVPYNTTTELQLHKAVEDIMMMKSKKRSSQFGTTTSTSLDDRIYTYLQEMKQYGKSTPGKQWKNVKLEKERKLLCGWCPIHSQPQVNFLIQPHSESLLPRLEPIKKDGDDGSSTTTTSTTPTTLFYPNLEFIGDISDMFPILIKMLNISMSPKVYMNDAAAGTYINMKHHNEQLAMVNETYIMELLNGGGRISINDPIKMKYFPTTTGSTVSRLSNRTIRAICEYVILDYIVLDYKLPSVCKMIYY